MKEKTQKELRDVYRLEFRPTTFDELKQGDYFVLKGDDYEDGTRVTQALGDAKDGGVSSDEVARLKHPIQPPEMVEVDGYRVTKAQHGMLQRDGNGELGLIFDGNPENSRAWVPLHVLQMWESAR